MTVAVNKWDKKYLSVNAKIADKNEFGAYQLEYDKEALELLEKEIDSAYLKFPSNKERMKWLIENDFYKKDLIRGTITLDDIEELYAVYEKYDKGEPRFFSLLTFLQSYSFKITDKDLQGLPVNYELPVKRYEDVYIIVEKRIDRTIANVLDSLGHRPLEVIKNAVRDLAKRNYHPSTPSYSNSGVKEAGQLTSCFILKFDDNITSIADMNSYTLHLSKMGGGLGYDITDVRALGENVRKLQNRTHGIVPVAKQMESKLQYADQDGKRRGSGAVYCSVHHPDFPSLLDAKKENVDEKVRLSDLSIGAILTNKFMQLVEQGAEDYYTFYPNSVYQEYGIKLSDIDMDTMYDELVANPNVRKNKENIQNMLNLIAATVSESGYPYIMFAENVNYSHTFKGVKIYCSNLCTEILQRQDNGYGVQCTLASINLLETFINNTLSESVMSVMEHLNGVITRTHFGVVEPVNIAKSKFKAVGLGDMNLHGLLAYLGIPYESEFAIDLVRAYFAKQRYEVLKASMLLTEVYGVFDEFENTTYADGTYFDKYLTTDYSPQTEKVQGIFSEYGIEMPTQEDWLNLKEQVMEKGLANAYQQAIAPTGTIGYSNGSTASIGAITQLVEKRVTGNGTAYYPMPNLEKLSPFIYKNAYNVSDYRYFDLVATMQEHVDQGISATYFITDNYTTADWWERIIYAWKIGLKTVYYTRPRISSYVECESCT